VSVFIYKKSLYAFIFFIFVSKLYLSAGSTAPLYGFVISNVIALIILYHQKKLYFGQIFLLFGGLFLLLTYAYVNPSDFVDQLKFLALMVSLLIIPFYYSKEYISKVFLSICVMVLVLSITLFFLGIGVSDTYGVSNYRMQGLLGEPSAMAVIIAPVFLQGLFFKRYLLLTLSIVGMILTLSPTVVFVSIMSLLVYFFWGIKPRAIKWVALVATVLFVILLVYGANNSSLSNPDPGGFVIGRLYDGILNIITLGEVGYNPRFKQSFEIILYLIDTNYIWHGFGISAGSVLEERALSLPFEILFSFGLTGVFIFIIISLYVVFSQKESKNFKIAFSSLLVYCMTNSAQGITIQILLLILFVVFFREKRFIFLARGTK